MKSCGKRDYFSDMSNSFVGSFWDRVTYKTEQFWNGRLYFPVMLAAAAVSMLSGNVVPSTVLLAVLCGWMLVFCRDILAAALPFLLIFLRKGAAEIASAYNLNDFASDIIAGVILFFILGSEFFINYRILRRSGTKEVR